jgi:hypothetical protein
MPMDEVMCLVERPALLRHIAFPLIVFQSLETGGFPNRWADGDHRVFMWQFGFLPLGPQTVSISRGETEDGGFFVRDNGRGMLARRWDHRISIKATGPETTHYVDGVAVDAGFLTPLVAAFAHVFYRWRQARWRSVVRNKKLQARLLAR